MYPYLFGVLPSYTVMMIVGILAAVACFRLLSDKTKLPAKVYNFYSLNAVASIAAGLLFAMLFQSVYNFFETGVFKLEGMTFMGGLIGGAGTFVLVTLLSKKREAKRSFFVVAEIAAPCVCLAHALGRIGCTLAGCCYGIESESGWFFPAVGKKVIPTQFIEACFLFVLFAALLVFTLRRSPRGFNLIIYCLAYAVFRFVIEFFRGDPRGAFVGALSPSQFQSIVLFLIGVGLLVFRLLRPDFYALVPEKTDTVEEIRNAENV